jgi:uncharacterized protein YchJ
MNNESKQIEPTIPTIEDTRKFLRKVAAGHEPEDAELVMHNANMKKVVAKQQGINENQVDAYLLKKRRIRQMLHKPKRKEPCPCGSGVQHRKCCGILSR